ncbi:Gfo/Idh/MocA family protein [Streptacidiphilus rugosus]|uniref:Gfo/Idh/MocA family protein n=1 Tax=Streptacidiphilus rugosus TaxID=405783 RepID=UPI0005652615|nr:Gfo/Idh/MocA family oxidoreductase [Streptacidiphilus rugosus]
MTRNPNLPSGSGVAVVGTGYGCLTHVPALRRAGFTVHALVGRDADRTAQRAARLGIPHAFTDVAAALAHPGIDAVTVATPPSAHADIVLQAVQAGKHVLCEKPFGRNAAEAARMLTAAERAGVVHLVGCEFRYATAQALAARAVADGAIGTPRLATLLTLLPMFADPRATAPAWWFDPEFGGGWLNAHAAHGIDQIRTTLGEFAGLSAGLTRTRERGSGTAEDAYSIHFELATGVDGVAQSSIASSGPLLMTTRITGSSGSLWIEGDQVCLADVHGRTTLVAPPDPAAAAPEPPPPDLLVTAYDRLHATGIDLTPYTRLAATFRSLIEDGKPLPGPIPATFADGLALARVLDAVRRSARERRWVQLAATDTDG